MALKLGLPEFAGGDLPRRLAWLTAARLLVLTIALALVWFFYLRGSDKIGSFTLQTLVLVLAVSYAVAGAYAVLLRLGRFLPFVADAQLLLDQLTCTVVVYVTGGATSGATSFYGLTCLVGAALSGFRGAAIAAVSGAVLYTSLSAAMQQGLVPIPPDQAAIIYELEPADFRFYLAANLFVLLLVALLAGTLAERLRWAGGELVLATERADRAERLAALGRLATGLAHEIRNPLGSIAGSVQLLKTTRGLSVEDQQLCEIIERETQRLNDLVSDMMDLTRPRRPVLLPVDLAQIAREVVELAGRSGRASSDVDVHYEGAANLCVQADGAMLRQLIWNLVRNAVQASSPGELVRVVVAERDDGRGELSVLDRGVGIDEEAKARLFDAFFTTRSHGTGVGLAVVKRIADDHGFEIVVDSGPNQGATFRVVLGPIEVLASERALLAQASNRSV
jgi:two-component system, NtrC family, sensor histidine kinase HydH